MLWRAVSKFAHPAGHTVAIADCSLAAGTVRVDVSVENQSDSPAAFTVFVEVIGPVLNRTIRTLTIAIPTVPAGSVADGSATFPSSVESVDCHIVAVGGPLPFGVDIGPVGVQG